ncbi:OmpA family protein [Ostreibacterium oceani]|uniref:OmpA family protein n=1 Tax=Ostreibacterium oceani TaxID=2654998 RepID=A0A6N7EU53_9GAMM|nr:OmpA family protein [Ostreibacterium oceani]MPV86081.1 OmpA family protein [Ostreibacterium oceani]
MNKNLKLVLVAATAASFAASAHTTPNALVDSSGNVVKNSFGDCVEAVYNDERVECGGNEAPPKMIEEVFTLGAHTLFDFDKSYLRAEGKAELETLASKIKEGKELGRIAKVSKVEVVGHTDSKGSVQYNQGLSERRAATVRNYLVQLGIPANMISAYGEGELNPVATNATEAGRQQNRRVEVKVQGVEKHVKKMAN